MTTILNKKGIKRVDDEKPGPFKTMIVIIPEKNNETRTEKVDNGMIQEIENDKFVLNSHDEIVCGGDACIFFANY